MIFLLLAVAIAVVGWVCFVIPRWEDYQAKKEQCQKEGHVFGPVYYAMDDWHLPTRKCTRCGFQHNLGRCVACGKLVDREKVRLHDSEQG